MNVEISNPATLLVAVLAGWLTACGGSDDGRPTEQLPPSFLEPCSYDSDCEGGLVCAAPVLIAKVCTMPCETDSDCPGSATCRDRGYCDDFLQ